MLDTLFKAGQSVSKHSLDLRIKTSIDDAGLRSLGADIQRITRLMKSTGAEASAVASKFRASQAEAARFSAMSPSAQTAYRQANRLGGSNAAALDKIRNRPYAELEQQQRSQARDRADQASEQSQMARQRQEALAPAHAAGDYVEQKGLSAISFGLGSDAWSFALNSAHHWMEMDSVLATLGRRFHSTGRAAGEFGRSLGFTVQQTSAMVEELGGKTDKVSKGQVKRYAGFARDFGLDPQAAMGVLGSIQQLTGRALDDRTLMGLAGRAQSRGMGEGRFQEYLQGFQGFAAQGMDATGRMDTNRYAGMYDLPGLVFGAQDPRGQGAMGAQFMQGLQGTMTGGGAMQSFMLRAMGFGKEGGPSYIEAKKRLEAGIYDSSNLTDMFGEFRARGMGKGAQFRAIESVAGGKLKAWQIEKLVDSVGTSDEGFAALKNLGSDEERQKYLDQAMGRYSASDAESFANGGFGEMGAKGDRVGAGDWNAAKIEDMQMAIGPKIAETMISMRDTVEKLAETFKKFWGSDPLDAMVQVGHALSEAADKLKAWMPEDAGAKLAEGFEHHMENAKFAATFLSQPVGTTIDVLTGAMPLPTGGAGP